MLIEGGYLFSPKPSRILPSYRKWCYSSKEKPVIKPEIVLSMMYSLSAKAKLLRQENIFFIFMTAIVESERRDVLDPV